MTKEDKLNLLLKLKQNTSLSWKEITESYNTQTLGNEKLQTLKKRYHRYKKSLEKKSENPKEPLPHKRQIEYSANGDINIINVLALNHDQQKDFDYILEVHGYSPRNYVIDNIIINEWGNKSDYEKQMYQVKMKIRKKQLSDFSVDDMAKVLEDFKYVHKKIEINKNTNETTAVYFFTDMHIGDSGTDVDEYHEVAELIASDIQLFGYGKVVINFMGDILHVDNVSKTTDKGTQLEMPIDTYDMVDLAIDTLISIVSRIAIVPTDIYWVEGNHSRSLEYSVLQTVRRVMTVNNDHIKFYTDKERRKAYLVYETLIGIHHGDMPKNMRDKWLQYEHSDLWGKACEWETYNGDKHQKELLMSGGLEINTLGTKNKVSNYAKNLGYGGYSNKVECNVYCKKRGKFRTEFY